jgi:hypothetical protein
MITVGVPQRWPVVGIRTSPEGNQSLTSEQNHLANIGTFQIRALLCRHPVLKSGHYIVDTLYF